MLEIMPLEISHKAKVTIAVMGIDNAGCLKKSGSPMNFNRSRKKSSITPDIMTNTGTAKRTQER